MTGHRQSMARSSVRLRPDMSRIADALSRPGIDPRAWVVLARVDDDPDAIVWDADIGWIVDVTFADGEGPITCRVTSESQGSSVGSIRPVRADSLVVVLVPNGDPNDEAVIIGDLHDVDTNTAPTTINTEPITEELAASTHIDAYPGESLDQEWTSVRITASEQLLLGIPVPIQSFVRGDDYADALGTFLDALDVFVDTLATAPPAAPNAALTVASVLAAAQIFQPQIATFKASRATYLSTRIKGD